MNQEPAQKLTLWDLARTIRFVLYVIAAGLLITGVIILGEAGMHHIAALEEWLSNLGPWALALFIFLYALLSTLFVPDMVLGVIAGTTFGFTHGFIAAVLGSFLGAALQFALARRLLRPAVDKMIASRPKIAALQTAVKQQELRLQLLIRLTPLNRTLTNFVLGASGVGFTRYLFACVGFIPAVCLEVYIGYAGRRMVGIASQQGQTAILQDFMLVAGLVIAIILMAIISRMARRVVESVAEASPSHEEASPSREEASPPH